MQKMQGTERIITGAGGTPLDSLVEQLWSTPVRTGQARVVVDAAPNSHWADAETYWVLPSPAKARLLIPRRNPRVTAAALRSYRALRPPKVRWARNALGLVARAGLPPALHTLSVQRPVVAGSPRAEACLPLEEITSCLQLGPLSAAIGIRLGDNRKPTLQLFDGDGRPAGYAKLAWNETSREYIQTEEVALTALATASGPTRVPRLLGTGKWDGFPYLITEPLPENVRAVRGNVGRPTPAEMFALTPVERIGTVSSTGHFRALSQRLRALPDGAEQALRAAATQTERMVLARDATLPITRRWHGDLVPWNAAREPGGQLWCWDWESAEPDAIAGLDALHWAISVRREAGTGTVAGNLARSLEDSALYLRAAGVPKSAEGDLAAVYALVVAERAWTLAVHNGGWPSSWISQQDLMDVLAAARTLMR
ncbi:hypothetical protein [Paenarthrobacter sp. PH39-S1]|uniref:hypothetical protein n=1 Tax=Paenarthrobacter sp. PH39-S1 TaxID=3046204 RepID=UPI0024B9CB31|nr:hypothetical protein [Paenarthrobacter sp. PH39-S1]MDJ0356122.1 hypothetical protein [Paenarthrobacter sp. PH39-S1]